MKKIIVSLCVVVSMYIYWAITHCGILPKDTDCQIVLGNWLYKLTAKGFSQIGYIYDDVWKVGEPYKTFFGNTQKKFYFNGCSDTGIERDDKIYQYGIYQLDLNKAKLQPGLVVNVSNYTYILSISPASNWLLFKIMDQDGERNDLTGLNLQTGKHQKLLINDYSDVYGTVWLNNHQFVYCSTNVKANNKHTLYLYDITTHTKSDMQLDGYYPGAVTPDGTKLLLANDKQTILYNIATGQIEILVKKAMRVTNAIWLPDGKGFLYTDSTWREIFLDGFILQDAHSGLYYYSVEKRRTVRLKRYHDLARKAGFIVPSDIKIKLPDTEINREIVAGKREDYHLIKICN